MALNRTSGLGRGLDSLIPRKNSGAIAFGHISTAALAGLPDEERVANVPVEKISPNPHQPRQFFDEKGLQELADSIREHGIIQPLIATKVGDNFELIAGERRWRAAKMAGLKTVPIVIRDFNEQKKLEIALIENIQRRDLNVLETAAAYQKLIDEFNLNQEQLAKKVGKERSTVANVLRILNAAPEVKEAIIDGRITEGHARALVGLPLSDQPAMLARLLTEKWNVREAEKASKEIVVKKHLRKVNFDPDLKAREEDLQRALGTKVEIKKNGRSGKIVISFFSQEEYNDLLDRLSGF